MTASLDMAMARAAAESLMSSSCTIRRRGEELVTDPETGEVTATPGAPVYSGECRVRPAGREAQARDVGGAEVFTFDYLISVPFSVVDVAEGDRLTITASPDLALVGVEVEVQKVDRGEHITARRLSCNEVA